MEIDRNAAGVPLFPPLKLSAMSPAAILSVINEYFAALWGM